MHQLTKRTRARDPLPKTSSHAEARHSFGKTLRRTTFRRHRRLIYGATALSLSIALTFVCLLLFGGEVEDLPDRQDIYGAGETLSSYPAVEETRDAWQVRDARMRRDLDASGVPRGSGMNLQHAPSLSILSIMPVASRRLHDDGNEEPQTSRKDTLLQELLLPLLAREDALCNQRHHSQPTPTTTTASASASTRQPSRVPGNAFSWLVHAAVVADIAAEDPDWVSLLKDVAATPVASQPPKTHETGLLHDHSYQAWSVSTRTLRTYLQGTHSTQTSPQQQQGSSASHDTPTSLSETPVACYGNTVTLVAIQPFLRVPGPPAGVDVKERSGHREHSDSRNESSPVPMELFVMAALASSRTALRHEWDYFLVLPSHVTPVASTTRMDHGRAIRFEESDAAETSGGTSVGFLEAMLQTAREFNKGRVAGVQCSLLTPDPLEADTMATGPPSVAMKQPPRPPASRVLSPSSLSRYMVLDGGAFIGFTTTAGADPVPPFAEWQAGPLSHDPPGLLLPFFSRRHAGRRGSDSCVLAAAPIDAASLHCGLFHQRAYDMSGGFADALQGFPSVPEHAADDGQTNVGGGEEEDNTFGRTVHNHAADSAGWKYSLHVQRVLPHWQFYRAPAAAVVSVSSHKKDEEATQMGALSFVKGLTQPLYSLADGYGQQQYPVLHRLHARRFGVPYAARSQALPSTTLASSQDAPTPPPSSPRQVPLPWRSYPPIVTYLTDFECSCCGLGLEADGYLRGLMDRYAVGALAGRDPCPHPDSHAMRMAFPKHRHGVFGDLLRETKGLPSASKPLSTTRAAGAAVKARKEALEFWHARFLERAQVTFLHTRAPRYVVFHEAGFLHVGSPVAQRMRVGRSVSEFDALPEDWWPALRATLLTDQLWVSSPFFKEVYMKGRRGTHHTEGGHRMDTKIAENSAGVSSARLRVIPEAVDTSFFDLDHVEPLPIPLPFPRAQLYDSHPELTAAERQRRFLFLSSFKWEPRKGWDMLLAAYAAAFGADAPPEWQNRTTLLLKVHFTPEYSPGVSVLNLESYLKRADVRACLAARMPNYTGSLHDGPHVMLLDADLSRHTLARLYRTAHAFVLPTRAEGWGLPIAEAMSMGLPVLATDWGGVTGFLTNETGFPIPIEGTEKLPPAARALYSAGAREAKTAAAAAAKEAAVVLGPGALRHVPSSPSAAPPRSQSGTTPGVADGKDDDDDGAMRWAIPNQSATAALMRYVMTHPIEAAAVGRRARAHMQQHFSEEAVADAMDATIFEFLVNQWKTGRHRKAAGDVTMRRTERQDIPSVLYRYVRVLLGLS